MFVFILASCFCCYCCCCCWCWCLLLISCLRAYTQDKENRLLGHYPQALRRNWALFFLLIFSNSGTLPKQCAGNLSLKMKDWATQTQDSVKKRVVVVLPKGLHRRAQTRQQWIHCTFIDWLQYLIDVFYSFLLFSIPSHNFFTWKY